MHINDVRKGLDAISKKVLLTKANVVSVGIGYKTSKGKKTDRLSVICLVEQKNPKNL